MTNETITPRGTPYETIDKGNGVTWVAVPSRADIKAAKRVRRNEAGYYSQDGQTFTDLDAVADGMRWAL
jgi:hypothetical protein